MEGIEVLAAGITIYAPSIILSVVLGWDLKLLVVLVGVLVISYTMIGGTKAVNVTQKQQMFIIFLGMFIAFGFILKRFPEGIGFSEALSIAGNSGKLDIINFEIDFNSRYTFWSGLTGGLFWHFPILELINHKCSAICLENLSKKVKWD